VSLATSLDRGNGARLSGTDIDGTGHAGTGQGAVQGVVGHAAVVSENPVATGLREEQVGRQMPRMYGLDLAEQRPGLVDQAGGVPISGEHDRGFGVARTRGPEAVDGRRSLAGPAQLHEYLDVSLECLGIVRSKSDSPAQDQQGGLGPALQEKRNPLQP